MFDYFIDAIGIAAVGATVYQVTTIVLMHLEYM